MKINSQFESIRLAGSAADRRKTFRKLKNLGGVRYKIKGRKLATGVKVPIAALAA